MICITVRENGIYFWLTPTFSFTLFDQHLLQSFLSITAIFSCVTPQNSSFDSQMLSPLKVVGHFCNAVTWEHDSKKWDCIDQLLMYTSRIIHDPWPLYHCVVSMSNNTITWNWNKQQTACGTYCKQNASRSIDFSALHKNFCNQTMFGIKTFLCCMMLDWCQTRVLKIKAYMCPIIVM